MPIVRHCANPACQKRFDISPSVLLYGRGLYCSKTCRWTAVAHARADPETEVRRFWDKVVVCRHGRDCVFCCWPWQGRFHRSGIPVFNVHRAQGWRAMTATSYAWMLLNAQPFPPGIEARHACLVQACVNGMHIYPGILPVQVRELLRQKIAAGRLRLLGWTDRRSA